MKKTYSATTWVHNTIVIELAINVRALPANVTGNLEVEVELSIRVGRLVGEDGNVSLASRSLSDTQVNRRPVTHVASGLVPAARILDRGSRGVDVVLRAGRGAAPGVVLVGVRAGELVLLAGLGVKRDSLGLGTGVISAADGDVLVDRVLDLDLSGALDADLLAQLGIGELELALGVTVQAADGLAGVTLGSGPLGLLVPGRAGV